MVNESHGKIRSRFTMTGSKQVLVKVVLFCLDDYGCTHNYAKPRALYKDFPLIYHFFMILLELVNLG